MRNAYTGGLGPHSVSAICKMSASSQVIVTVRAINLKVNNNESMNTAVLVCKARTLNTTAMKKNIFLTGGHSSGKTAVIKKVIGKLSVPSNGFYIEEERVASKKVGFIIKTLDGRQGYLAHQDIKSVFNIRHYGVSVNNIDTIAVPSIAPVKTNIIIFDEIGKMECFSKVFKRAVIKALNSSNIVIGTIAPGGDDFIMAVRSREDVEIHEVTRNNRELLPDFILNRISVLLRHYGKKFPLTNKQLENTVL